jgi:hypothetical protein
MVEQRSDETFIGRIERGFTLRNAARLSLLAVPGVKTDTLLEALL